MKQWIHFLAVVALVLMGARLAAAQGNNRVDGQVLDPQGNPLADATVTLKSEDSGQAVTVKTDKNGKFVQLGLRAGIYDVSVTSTNQQIPPYTQKFQLKEGESGTLVINYKELMAKYANFEEAKKREEEANTFKNMKAHFDAGHQAMVEADAVAQQISSAPADQKAALQEKRTTDCQTAATEFDQAEKGVGTKDAKNHAVVLGNLGAADECAGKYDEAAAAFQKAAELEPSAPLYRGLSTNLAKAAGSLTDPAAIQAKVTEAGAACDKAGALDPAVTASCWKNVGIALYNKQHQKEATVAFQKAAAADAKDAQTWFLLGSSLAAQIDSKEEGGKEVYTIPPGTTDAYQKCIDVAPNGPYAPQCKAGLDELAQLSGGVPTSVGKKKH
jgi:tetratricopeptide (TPR) repeat protein